MTHNDWILDVLADLKSFAAANGLGALAERGWDTMVGWGWRDALAKLRKGGYDVR